MDEQDVERSFPWPVLVTPPTPAYIARDRSVVTRATSAARTRAQAHMHIHTEPREVRALHRQKDTRPEGTTRDTGMDLYTAPTTGTGIPADAAAQVKVLHPSLNSEVNGDKDAHRMRGAPTTIPTPLIQDPAYPGPPAGCVAATKVGLSKPLEKFRLAGDDDGLESTFTETSAAMMETPEIYTNTSEETSKSDPQMAERQGLQYRWLRHPKRKK